MRAEGTETETVCQVCGYDEEVFWEDGWPTNSICPCCGNESDVGDASVVSVRQYRGYWLGHGARWNNTLEERIHKERGWDLLKQMANVPPEWR